MTLLNEFLKTISMRADDNDELHGILRDFLEPDTNDKKIHGGAVIRTVNIHLNIYMLEFFPPFYWQNKRKKSNQKATWEKIMRSCVFI